MRPEILRPGHSTHIKGAPALIWGKTYRKAEREEEQKRRGCKVGMALTLDQSPTVQCGGQSVLAQDLRDEALGPWHSSSERFKKLPSTVFSYPCQYLILSVDILKNLTVGHKKFDLIVFSYISIWLFLRSIFFSISIFLVTSCLLILLTEFSVGHFFFFSSQLL